ncbi:hypothetical protein B0H10DRAFT_1954202 [Mycena sp. CBHHK59/15]|nr:hypothetical protein B0H10DRAFT_1954202 [Mycena sp. CBHHK59/15]
MSEFRHLRSRVRHFCNHQYFLPKLLFVSIKRYRLPTLPDTWFLHSPLFSGPILWGLYSSASGARFRRSPKLWLYSISPRHPTSPQHIAGPNLPSLVSRQDQVSEPFNLSTDPISSYQDVLIEGIGVFGHNMPGKSHYRYATLQYTVRIQSDADFPCNVRDTEWPLIWGIYSAFGRVRRRIDWTNAHAPSTQYVVVLERLMSLETGLTKVVLERSGALDAGLTEQQPTVPPTCQPIALNDSLPYRQPFNTFLSTVRIQSDADFPWNGRTFGRVRRRIDWTNAHAPSTRPTIALNDSATLQYICDERLSMFGPPSTQHVVVLERLVALETGLTKFFQLVKIHLHLTLKRARNRIDWVMTEVPPTCQPIALNDSLPYCQPFNTFLSTVRIQSDADFPWNGRTPSSSPTIAFNDSATPQYICNERLSTFGCELTWQQPRLLQLVRIHLCLTVKHARNRIDLITAESQLSQVFDIPVSDPFNSFRC